MSRAAFAKRSGSPFPERVQQNVSDSASCRPSSPHHYLLSCCCEKRNLRAASIATGPGSPSRRFFRIASRGPEHRASQTRSFAFRGGSSAAFGGMGSGVESEPWGKDPPFKLLAISDCNFPLRCHPERSEGPMPGAPGSAPVLRANLDTQTKLPLQEPPQSSLQSPEAIQTAHSPA